MERRPVTLECTTHRLRFEVPHDWHERGMPAPDCYLCMTEKLKRIAVERDEALAHRDTLLAAFRIKTTVRVSSMRGRRQCPSSK